MSFKNFVSGLVILTTVGLPFSPESFAAKKHKTVRPHHNHVVQQTSAEKKHKLAKLKKLNTAKMQRRAPSALRRVSLDYTPDLDNNDPAHLVLRSAAAMVMKQRNGEILYKKNANIRTPIASITKLMTAMVTLDANLSMTQLITVIDDDVDTLRNSSSRLRVGSTLTREELLHLALMSSENRAAAALARTYPAGRAAFIKAMNRKAHDLGMTNSRFYDSTGLDGHNSSTAEDLAKMVYAAYQYSTIREFSTGQERIVTVNGKTKDFPVVFHNTNMLIYNKDWQIGLSKTGYINEAGRCLVMQTTIQNEPIIIVLLDSTGKYSRIGDANRIRKWIEIGAPQQIGVGANNGYINRDHSG